jgi:hypothetical protein
VSELPAGAVELALAEMTRLVRNQFGGVGMILGIIMRLLDSHSS